MAGENKSPRQVQIKTPDQEDFKRDKEHEYNEDSDFDTDKEGESRPQSVRIDLTRIRSAYSAKTHKESNLPPLLTEYGMDDEKHKEKGRRKKKKIKSEKENEDDVGVERRKKKREERYQQIMENQDEGGNLYSKRVSDIVSRVKSQSDSRSQTPQTPRTPRLVEEEEKPQKMPLKKKLQRHDLSTNTEFLKTIPKTEMAKIIELQDKLMKEGKLKTQAEVDIFWQDIKKPDVYMSYFKPQPQPLSGSGSSLSRSNVEVHSTVTALQDYPGRSLSQISERSSIHQLKDTQDWAVTQQFKHQHSKTPSAKTKGATDLEKKFPKATMPPLHCFTMDLGEKPPDPEQQPNSDQSDSRMSISSSFWERRNRPLYKPGWTFSPGITLAKEAELKVKIKQRKRFLRKLNRMHQMAMANNAATNRILDKHQDLTSMLDGNTLRDVISFLPAPEDQYISEEDLRMPEPLYPPLPQPRSSVSRGSSKTRSLVSRESRASLASRESFRKESSRRKLGSREQPRPAPPPIPLTLDEIRQKTRSLDAKCLSTNWINYMRSGRTISSES